MAGSRPAGWACAWAVAGRTAFLALTGHAAEEEDTEDGGKRRRGRRKGPQDAENAGRATS